MRLLFLLFLLHVCLMQTASVQTDGGQRRCSVRYGDSGPAAGASTTGNVAGSCVEGERSQEPPAGDSGLQKARHFGSKAMTQAGPRAPRNRTKGHKRENKKQQCENMGGVCKHQKTHGCSILPAECRSRNKHCCRV